ncbi:MAG: cell division protein FtsZ, partial [Sphingomonas sp.]|nr:cell division protein FtsZ [Sphingomonas sp.]
AAGGGGDAAAEPSVDPMPKSKSGGTLFERMSNVTRGPVRDDDNDGRDPPDIPRFLNRQNNQ